MKTVNDINKVMIAGAGTLGMRIALRCAFDGYQVSMFDISTKQLEAAQSTHAHLIKSFLKRGQVSAEQAELARANLHSTDNIEDAIDGVDLISESVIESLDVKREFYQDLTPRLEPGVILTTNTSFLMPSQWLDVIKQPELFCALHFHDVFNQRVLDVMPHAQTSQATVDLLMAFGKRINHIPVHVKKESPGYLFNAMFGDILGKAGVLFIDGIGSIQDIDRSFMGNFHTPAGPFGMLDQVGLDTAWHIMSSSDDEGKLRFAEELKKRVDAGKLGYKSGEGFYTYPRPEYREPGFLDA